MSDDNRVEVRIEGLAELDEALAQFSEKVAKKSIYNALNYALTPMVKDVKQRATVAEKTHKMLYGRAYVEVQPGLIRESIRRRRLKKSEIAKLRVSAGVAIHAGKGKTQKYYPKYWPFVEYGTVKMVAIPFFRPAFDANIRIAFDRFYDKLAKNIEKEQALLDEVDNDG